MRPPARAEWLALADRIVSHPATWLAAGNAVLVNHVSGLLSALPAAASAVLVIATIAAAYRRGEEAKLPFFIHGTLTVTSGLLALGEVLARVPAAELAAFEPQVRGDLLASAAIVGWGVGHLFFGRPRCARLGAACRGRPGAFRASDELLAAPHEHDLLQRR